MIKITQKDGYREIESTDKYLHALKREDVYFKKGAMFDFEVIEDFEEVEEIPQIDKELNE